MALIWPNYYDIVIIPSREVSDYAKRLSKEFGKFGSPWKLGSKSYVPHISLYHIPVTDERFEEFEQVVATILLEQKLGKLQTKEIEGRLLFFDKPQWIQKLCHNIMQNTVQYFDWENPFFKTSWPLRKMKLTAGESQAVLKKYLKEYGTPIVGEYFRPHITLAGSTRELPELPFEKLAFHADTCAIYELGPSHSCQRLVKEWRITK